VCRQREYLADAAAVQFTRQSEGLTNVLRKIGGSTLKGHMRAGRAEEVSYMCIARARRSDWGQWMATHPPLPKRIQRLWPEWDGAYIHVKPLKKKPFRKPQNKAGTKADWDVDDLFFGFDQSVSLDPTYIRAEDVIDIMGHVEQRHVRYAQGVLARLPVTLKDLASEPFGAQVVLAALLLNPRPAIRQAQIDALDAFEGAALAPEVARFAEQIESLGVEKKLPLMELALPALQWLSETQRTAFRKLVDTLARADQEIDLFEYTLCHVLKRRLRGWGAATKQPSIYTPHKVMQEIQVILSTMAYAGHPEGNAEQAFSDGSGAFSRWGLPLRMLTPEECSLDEVDRAIAQLNRATGKVKKSLMHAMAVCIGFDDVIRLEEAELFRAVAEALGCPVPPLFAREA